MNETYESLVTKLSKHSNTRIVELLNLEKNNPGWTNSRALFLSALNQVAKETDISRS